MARSVCGEKCWPLHNNLKMENGKTKNKGEGSHILQDERISRGTCWLVGNGVVEWPK